MNHEAIRTTCPYCGVGCGLLVTGDGEGGMEVRGDPAHPANRGRLCSKGASLGETLGLEGRLLYPEIAGGRCSWDDALAAVSDGFRRVIAAHGPEAVAFYVSGQLLTEDYYVANKLMKGFIGSANIDTNSRLCMSSAVAGYKRAFGSDTVPCAYEDLERAKLILLVGSNTAWCHPVLFQRISQAKRDNPDLKVVVIDPRRTPTCDIADLHLPLKPGSDAALFNGLLVALDEQGEGSALFTDAHTEGLAAALAAARASAPSVEAVAAHCGLEAAQVAELYRLFARTERVVTAFSQGVNQSSSGTDKANAIINCHLFTGRIGRPGMGPFSLTGQPNAMGGREVGGLANQLAAHMAIEDAAARDRVRRFWDAPALAATEGLKAVDLFREMEQGRIKAVWIMATNPVVSLPDADRVRRALERCELVVVSDCIQETDTTACADVRLPALTWGERDGTVTNSERRISRQRPFLHPPGEAKPDWWILTQVARRTGFARQFPYQRSADIFREHARLSGFENGGSRDFDISAVQGLTDDQYDALEPFQWPAPPGRAGGTPRLFADGRFYTPDGKARFVAVTPRPPAYGADGAFPLVLNTGRVRDQWHTMTRTGRSPRLSSHVREPFVEVHPEDAIRFGLRNGGLARVASTLGAVVLRVRVSEQQRPGSLFVPIHWNGQFASRARVGALVNPVVDPVSGQPESKHTPVRVEPYQPAWYGFILSRRPLQPAMASYWVRSRGQGIWQLELAGEQAPRDWARSARELLCAPDEKVGWIEYFDVAAQRYRAARLVNNRLESCIFIGPDFELPGRDWLAGLFDTGELKESERIGLLSGRPAAGQPDRGRTVCACFGVGINTLREAIQRDELTSVEAIGKALKAGTNCGSCIPELRALLKDSTKGQAA